MAKRKQRKAPCSAFSVVYGKDDQLKRLTKMAKSATTVVLWGEEITNAALEHLKKFRKLRELHLVDCKKVTDEGFCQIEDLEKLEWLNVDNVPVSNKGLVCIRNLKQLKGLHLVGAKVTDSGLWKLRRLKQLEYLDLQNTDVGNGALKHLVKMKGLKTLRLVNTRISDTGLVYFAEMRGLENLYLNKTRVTSEGVSWLRLLLPKTCCIDVAAPLPEWTARFAW